MSIELCADFHMARMELLDIRAVDPSISVSRCTTAVIETGACGCRVRVAGSGQMSHPLRHHIWRWDSRCLTAWLMQGVFTSELRQ